MARIEDSRNGHITTDDIGNFLISNYDKERYVKDPEEFKKNRSLYVNFNIMKDYDKMLDLFLRYVISLVSQAKLLEKEPLKIVREII